VTVVSGDQRFPLERVVDGLFAGPLPAHPGAYKLEADYDGTWSRPTTPTAGCPPSANWTCT